MDSEKGFGRRNFLRGMLGTAAATAAGTVMPETAGAQKLPDIRRRQEEIERIEQERQRKSDENFAKIQARRKELDDAYDRLPMQEFDDKFLFAWKELYAVELLKGDKSELQQEMPIAKVALQQFRGLKQKLLLQLQELSEGVAELRQMADAPTGLKMDSKLEEGIPQTTADIQRRAHQIEERAKSFGVEVD